MSDLPVRGWLNSLNQHLVSGDLWLWWLCQGKNAAVKMQCHMSFQSSANLKTLEAWRPFIR